jgi:hypothetical protein
MPLVAHEKREKRSFLMVKNASNNCRANGRAAAEPADWASLARRYDEACTKNAIVADIVRAINNGQEPEAVCQSLSDELTEELCELCRTASSRRASNSDQLRTKARMLLEMFPLESEDLMSAMCVSLCEDVLAGPPVNAEQVLP